MEHFLSFLVWIRRTLGAAVITGVVTVMLHLPKPLFLTASAALVDEGPMPDLGGAVGWLNSEPLNRKSLRGKVVLVDFWTYTCLNSLQPLRYVKAWATKYKEAGLVVIGALGGLPEKPLRWSRIGAAISWPLHPSRGHLQPSAGFFHRWPSHLSLAPFR